VTEAFARVGDDMELCFETFGDPERPTMLLIMGLATQMLGWDEAFCGRLAARGFHVVRFDNRDTGRSSRAKGEPPTLKQLIVRDRAAASYTLSDLAGDAVRLLDHLGVAAAHVVGASMGGMIAQTLAIEHGDRVLSLCSIMSNPGGLLTGQPAFSVLPLFLRRPPRDREAYAEHLVTLFARIGSSGDLGADDEHLRAMALASFDRGISAAGNGRQLAAILADRGREERLGAVRAPTLVIHGTADRLVRPSGGRATADAIPGANLMLVEGMGHDLPRGAWDRIIEGIVSNASRARATPDDDTARAA
jgi:pimeloyl-ACP methyl ester carboxylesterase